MVAKNRLTGLSHSLEMVQLLRNETGRARFPQYILVLIIGNVLSLFLAVSSSGVMSGSSPSGLSTVDLGMMLMRSVLIVWQAVLIAQIVIGEYQSRTITVLFAYPYSRGKIITSKLLLISSIMVSAHLISTLVQHVAVFFLQSTNPAITFTMQNPLNIVAVSLSSIFLAFLPMAIGMKFKSTITTIVSSLVIAAIVSNTQGSSAGILSNPVIAIVLGAIGLAAGIYTYKNMLKEDL
ncbi:MAG: ABC transporter permease subunit [Puniceicoccales bacterium]|nr:ABC transporter permease subunit [Puniceicoccales bacterium]